MANKSSLNAGFLFGGKKVKSLRNQKKRFCLKEHNKRIEPNLGQKMGEVFKKYIQREERQSGLFAKDQV